jgi:voltage-gated potassium channel
MEKELSSWRNKLHEVIFGADTKSGKVFDVTLLLLIIISVVLVMLESVSTINDIYGDWFHLAEWIITIFFTIEYILRLICVFKPSKYVFSFYGIIDLISILPSYIELFLGISNYLSAVRAMRLLRVFRIFKLAKFLKESNRLVEALKASQAKITVFIFFVFMIVIVIGSLMYLIEGGPNSDFTSIPRSIYWAIVTLTTVGYGDIAPVTATGQFIAAIVMLMGYAVIAVPTGIVSAEIAQSNDKKPENNYSAKSCQSCLSNDHDMDAQFCKHCGEAL